MLSSSNLNNIVLTSERAKTWNFIIWFVVIALIVYISLWLTFKFIDFALKSNYIFKIYSLLLVLSIMIVFIISILFVEVHHEKLHIHHYFVGCFLVVYSPSYYHPSDKKKLWFINSLVIHILTVITQAVLLGVIIDGVSNYGIKTIFV